jgi:hypothetical protein
MNKIKLQGKPDANKASGSSPGDDSFIAFRQISERFHVKVSTVHEKSRRRCLNPLPVIRIGRYLRFDWLEVSAWLRLQSERAA